MALNAQQRQRYARQIVLPQIGEAGQEKLLAARVLVVGAGGLGSPAAFYLAAAGVGTLGIADKDVVELSNLQRQILHRTTDIGRDKVASAGETLRGINPEIRVQTHKITFARDNAAELVRPYDFVVDAMDNFAGKFLVADVCHETGTPYSHAGILQFSGQTITVLPGKTACYRCVFEEPAPDCGQPLGPFGVVPGVIGTIQATEAIKYVVGCGTLLTNRFLVYDALEMSVRVLTARRNPRCPLCGRPPA